MINRGKRETLLGRKFNHLLVIEEAGRTDKGQKLYLCQCECGKRIEAIGKYVKAGDKKSCGCQKGKLLIRDLSNKKFGRLQVLKLTDSKKHKSRWECRCDCGEVVEVLSNSLVRGKTKSCGCWHREIVSSLKEIHKYNEIPYTYFYAIKASAARRNLNVTISIEDIWEQYLKQNKKCYFTKLPIGFCDNQRKSGYGNTASVDRLDSSKGYEKGNICLVYRDINFMKQNFSVDKFVNYCKLVIQNYV